MFETLILTVFRTLQLGNKVVRDVCMFELLHKFSAFNKICPQLGSFERYVRCV